jgi:hypothetical protein
MAWDIDTTMHLLAPNQHCPQDPPMDGMSLHDRIVECTWVPERHSWKFLRVREDKDKPNASHVYAKVSSELCRGGQCWLSFREVQSCEAGDTCVIDSTITGKIRHTSAHMGTLGQKSSE